MTNHAETRQFRGLMAYRGYTLEDVSKLTGMSLATIYKRLETDSFKVCELRRICSACEIDPRELLDIFFSSSRCKNATDNLHMEQL